jgi:thiamine biosynthesis lipoprotein
VSNPVRFGSMGCEVVVQGASASELRAIRKLFRQRERTFSRFIAESELNKVNHAAGQPVEVSPVFAAMLALARLAEHETGGIVTPTLGAELEAAGYDRDFESLGDDPRPLGRAESRPHRVQLTGTTLLTSPGVRIDLNGVVKSRTVDDALLILSGPGWVSAGGDLGARGPVVVGLPRGGSVTLARGGMATSGSDRRRWLRAGNEQHHLIDPRTGAPAISPWQQVTVCGRSCLSADVAAKCAFLLGPLGPAWLDRRGIPARFVTSTGSIQMNQAWSRSLGEAAQCI